jgi:hypothetical protein
MEVFIPLDLVFIYIQLESMDSQWKLTKLDPIGALVLMDLLELIGSG